MDDYTIHLVDEFRAGEMSRRELLRRASVAGISLSSIGALLGTDVAAAAPAHTAVAQIKRGGTARIGSQIPSADPDPVTASNAGMVFTYQPSLEYLCYPRPDWTLDPRLATSWSAGSSPKTWTFTIRKGVHWHDGSPLTVDDVVATFERLLDPKTGSSAGSIYHGVLSHGNVEKVGSDKVRFHLEKPFVDFPYLVSGFAYQSAIVPRNYQVGDFTKGNIGTGPYVLQQYVAQQSATYTANKSYWGKGMPYMDGLKIQYFGDEAATALAMQAGNIDIYPVVPLKGAESILRDKRFTILRHQSADYRSLHMRTDKAPLNDKRVRQAIAYSIDRAALVKKLFNGAATVANDHSFAPVYVDTQLARHVPQRKQDLKKAKALLAAAGHQNGLKLTLTTENYLEMSQYAVAIKQYCKQIGIDVNLNIMPVAQYYGSGKNQPWLVVPFGMTDWAARGTASQAIIPEFPCGAVWNSAHWCDHKFTSLFNKYNAELDHGKRRKLAEQLAKMQNDEVPVAIAYWIGAQRAVTNKVHGLPAAPDNFLDLRAVWLS